jgi:hypothetical protein
MAKNREFSELGLKNIYNTNQSFHSTQGKNGFYRDTAPGTKYPRKGAFAYSNPENGISDIRIAPEK